MSRYASYPPSLPTRIATTAGYQKTKEKGGKARIETENAAMSKQLLRQADALLRRNGFTRTGQPRREVSWPQLLFEKRVITIPMGGKPKTGGPMLVR